MLARFRAAARLLSDSIDADHERALMMPRQGHTPGNCDSLFNGFRYLGKCNNVTKS